MFGFGKKKETKSAADELFKELGKETNEVKLQGKQKRADAVAAVENTRLQQAKKEQVLERFAELRKILYANPEYDECAERVDKLIYKLNHSPENPDNREILGYVDNFILDAVKETINHSNRGNMLALDACLDNLNDFINDRYQGGIYYTNSDFVKFKLERNRINIEMQNEQQSLNEIVAKQAKLKALWQNPNRTVSDDQIARQAKSLKEEKLRIMATIDGYSVKVGNLEAALVEIKKSDIYHAPNAVSHDDFSEVLDMKRENEMEETADEKINAKLHESHRKVSAKSLDINDDISTGSSSIEINDDLFN